MDNSEAFLVNLPREQVRPPDGTEVHLRNLQEDHRMLKPEIVDLIREFSGQGLGSKRIARQLGISRNAVRRYLAGARVGFQERPAARRLDEATQREVQRLFATVAEGNTVVVHQELAAQGIHVDLRTLQRATAPRAPAPWPRSGSRPHPLNRCRSTSAKRRSQSPESPSRCSS
jgi:predicted transcriptional regulator